MRSSLGILICLAFAVFILLKVLGPEENLVEPIENPQIVPTKEELEDSLKESWDVYCSFNECKG